MVYKRTIQHNVPTELNHTSKFLFYVGIHNNKQTMISLDSILTSSLKRMGASYDRSYDQGGPAVSYK